MSPSDTDWEALARYLAGESSPGEAAAMRRWLAERPENAELASALAAALDAAPAAAEARGEPIDVEGALRKVHARITQPNLAVVHGERTPPRLPRLQPRRERSWSVPAAIAAAAVLGAAALFWQKADRPDPSQVAAAATHATPAGGRDSVRLADGTMVRLGPATTLVIPGDYNVDRREVELRGVAHFDVVHGTRPFTVRAGEATIVDVGTAFVVRSDSASGVRVVVTAGSVLLSAQGRGTGTLLNVGDVGTVAPGGTIAVARGTGGEADTAFIRGRLVLRDAAPHEVAAELYRWYGITWKLTDSSLARRRVTATFERETPAQAVRALELALGARIELRNDTAFVRPLRSR
jgi:transmembrane sensor